MDSKNISGIILAGGKSSRMGKDKALLEWNGKTLLQHAVDKLTPLCSEIFISSANPNHAINGCLLVPDELSYQAPMIGIYSCLKKSSNERNIVLSCDMPLISIEFLKFIINQSSNYDIVVASNNQQIEPLCGVYSKNTLVNFNDRISSRNFSLQHLIINSHNLLISVEEHGFNKTLFSNINTFDDFETMLPV